MNYPKMTTGRGTAIWPRLNEPDTKFKAEGKYECSLAFDEDDPQLAKIEAEAHELAEAKLAEIKEELESKGKKALAQKIKLISLIREEEDEETGEPTGRKILKATMTASGVSKKTGKPWKRKPEIFDGRGRKLLAPPKIGSGSTLKMSIELFPYYAPNDKTVGCTFRLEAVQLIKLVSFGERSASEHGFGAEDDADELDDTPPFDTDSSDSAGDDEDDEL